MFPEIEQFFIQPDQEAEIHVPANYQPGGAYVLTDYQGKEVAKGQAEARLGEWFVPVKLKAGYYDLDFPDAKRHFGLLAISKYEGKPDPFFGMDAALSWLAPVPQREPLIRILKRSGIAMVRERMAWPKLKQEDETWDWEKDRAFGETRRLYAKYDLPLLELAHESPAAYLWNGVGKGPAPDDVVRSVQDWKVISQKWASTWGAIEAWNEPDLQNAPADQYAYWAWTMRYALRNSGVQTPLGGGVFAYMAQLYLDLAAKNGLLEASDFISFHYYGEPQDLPRHISVFRHWLKANNREAMPLWLTESGAYWSGPKQSRPKLKQIQTSAMKIAGNAIQAKACGIERVFPFVYVDYTERELNNFGMMDSLETPTRSMAAYAATVSLLSNKTYIGDITGADGKICAQVFAPKKGDAVLVFLGTNVDPSATVPLPFVPRAVYGADGRSLKPDAAVPVPDGLGFATAQIDTVRPLISTDSITFKLAKISHKEAPRAAKPSPIVLKPQMKNAAVSPDTRGYRVESAPGKLSVPVLAANLDSVEHNVKLEYRKEGDRSPGGLLGTVSAKIPANGSLELQAEVDFSRFPAGEETRLLEVVPSSPDVSGKIPPSVMRFMFVQGLDDYLKKYSYQFALPLGEEHRWRKNATPNATLHFEHSPEAQWGFSAQFAGGDRWAYPQFTIPQEAKLERVTGVLIRARMMKQGTPRVITWNSQEKQSTFNYQLFPADGKWHVAYAPLDSFVVVPSGEMAVDAASLGRQVKKISIGFNSRENQNQLEVSDFYLIGN